MWHVPDQAAPLQGLLPSPEAEGHTSPRATMLSMATTPLQDKQPGTASAEG